jgi:L-rhamnonate dehydratase
MKITAVETIAIGSPGEAPPKGKGRPLVTPLNAPIGEEALMGPTFAGIRGGPVWMVLVRVHTDTGLTGLGSVGVGSGAAQYIIEKHLAELIAGRNPFDVELIWELMFRATLNYGRKGLVIEAISAIDIALWDIMGQACGQPVYNLLGGRTKERIPVYASRLYANQDLDALADEARGYVRDGFKAVKQRFGYGPRDGQEGMKKNLELVKTVRQAIGEQIDLMADAYMGWDVPYAIAMIQMLEAEGLRLRWVEEPLIPDDLDGYARLRASMKTPISGGEHEFTRYGFKQLIEKGAVDVLQPDVNRVGGITEARKIWALAAAHNLPVIPHAGEAHNYHLVISQLNSPMGEYFLPPPPGWAPDEDELFWFLYENAPRAADGLVDLGAEPGIGLRLNQENVGRWRLA